MYWERNSYHYFYFILSFQKHLHSVDSGKQQKPLSSVLDTAGSSLKLLHAHPSATQHHQSLGRSTFFKRSRHYYAHQYSRRNSGNASNASTSRGKGTPSRDDKLSYKLAAQCSSDSGRRSGLLFVVLLSSLHFFGSMNLITFCLH